MSLQRKTLAEMLTFTRAGTATYFGPDGLLKTAAADQPRFDYDPVTLQPRGLLIEESRTNYFTYSGDAASAWTVKSGSTVLSDVETAPDGTVTADAIMESTSTGEHYTERIITLAANQFITYETFVKPKGSYREVWLHLYANGYSDNILAKFNTVTGTVIGTAVVGTGSGVTASITPFSNGWYRLRLTGQVTTAAVTDLKLRIAFINSSTIYTGDGTSGIYVWGAQLEAGAFATSYIPTTTAAATRASDVCLMAGANFSRWFNPIEGTIVVEFLAGALHSSRNYGLWNISPSGTYGGDVMAGFSGSGSAGVMSVNSGGVGQAYITGGNFTPYAVNRMAAAYKANDFARSINGGAVLSDTSGAIPAGLARLDIGKLGASFEPLDGHLRRLLYYPRRLDNSRIQELAVVS